MGRNAGAMSSEGSVVGTGDAPAVNTVVISDQELTVISVHSSDTEPDSSEEGCLFNVRCELVLPSPTAVPEGALESPSHYSIPTAPVELSAVSSVLISPNRVREDY